MSRLVVTSFVLAAAALACVAAAKGSPEVARVAVSRLCDGQWCAVPLSRPAPKGHPTPHAAEGSYTRSMNTTGWNVLNVTTNARYSDEDQAYAAGFAEGALTYVDIVAAINNGPVTATPQLTAFMKSNLEWMYQQIGAHHDDPYWHQVNLTLIHFHGILDGANSVCPPGGEISLFNLWGQATLGDVMDIIASFNVSSSGRTDWRHLSPKEFQRWLAQRSHCSALVKLAFDLSDIYFGHATWSSYNFMLRVYKHYSLQYRGTAAKEVSFSSYPGTPVSIDDFYVTDSGLAITETTLNVFNYSIYDGNVVPQSLLYWVRVSVANRIADSAKDWVEVFGRHNSGTYNNQWIVLDLNKFTALQDLPPGTLYISEQMPGLYMTRDVTAELRLGYWPSYNIPSIVEVFDYAGYPAAIAIQGPSMLDYEQCVRAQIFRRDQANVSDSPSMQLIMQYNDFEHDPLSMDNPVFAIAARGDLGDQPMCFGAIDAKITTAWMYQAGRQVMAFSGPTPQQGIFSFENLPPSAVGALCAHEGVPDSFDFLWQTMSPFAADVGRPDGDE